MTLEEFAAREALENTTDPAAQQLRETLAIADRVVVNDGSLDALRTSAARALGLEPG